MISILIVIYAVLWHTDRPKFELLWTFFVIWIVSSFPLLGLTFFQYKQPVFRYPRPFPVWASTLIGLGGGLGLVYVSAFLQKFESQSMSVLQLPEIVEELMRILRGFPLKLDFTPVFLDWFSGATVFFWQLIVAGVEEGFKLAFTLALAYLMYFSLKRRRAVSPMERAVILSVSCLIVGGCWLGMHGFHTYTRPSEYWSATVGLVVISGVTFLTGNPLPGVFMHFFYNVMAPAVAVMILHSVLSGFVEYLPLWAFLSLFLCFTVGVSLAFWLRGRHVK